jgi:hypothetical protein
MALTKDAVISEFTANPTLKTEVFSSLNDDFKSFLKEQGISLRTKDEETEFLSNYEKTVIPDKVNAEIGQKVKAVHDQYDEDLFKLTGKRKAGNQKTYDFLKEQIEEIKKAQKKGDHDPVLDDKLKELQSELEKRKDWVPAEKLSELETKYFNESINSRLSLNLDKKPIAAPPHITDEKAKQEYAATQREMIKTNFLQKFTPKKDADGNIVFYLGDKLQINTATAKPLTEAELIDLHYSSYFVPETKTKTGTGTGGGKTAKAIDTNEASLKTKEDVTEFLNKKYNPQGIKVGNKKWNDDYQRILTEQGITE